MSFVNTLQDISVVLVEPSLIQARLIQEHLAKQGVVMVRHVCQGQEALVELERAPVDLLISAMYLPDMSGSDLITQIREAPFLADLAFILISSETRPQVLEPVRQSGASAILPKPFTDFQLATALRATLEYIAPTNNALPVELDFDALRVLIVDDSRSARHFIRHVFEQLKIQNFFEASNGKEAVAVLSENYVDLVVTDYNMPEMDGRALVEYIRQQSWQASVPVLMVSSEQDESRLAAVEQAGVSAIFDKPFDPSRVRELVVQVLTSGG